MGNLSPGTLLQGRYRIVDEVGKGAMAVVYDAEDQLTGTRVAVKQMGSYVQSPEEFVLAAQQFEQEARLLHTLNHPNIPRVHEWFEEGQERFLVMDFIDGQVLSTQVDLSGADPPARLPAPTRVLNWSLQIAQALRYLHAQKPRPVIYKDLKPDNLMLTQDGTVKMLDFGIAKGRDAQGRYFTILKGMVTPGFGAPEQYSTQATDPRADVYSLGATMYALLTGRVPPESIARQQAFINGKPDPLLPITQLRPEISAELEDAVMQMLAIKRNERLQTADVILEILAQVPEATALRASAAAPPEEGEHPTPAAVHAALDQPRAPQPDLDKEWDRTRLMLYLGAGVVAVLVAVLGMMAYWSSGIGQP